MQLTPLPAFNDNYIWMLDDGRNALIVDPGDAAPAESALAGRGLELQAILVTHHHADHTGGVARLRDQTGARVFGPAQEQIPQPSTPMSEGDELELLGLTWRVLDVPGHTAGHIAYFCEQASGGPLLFCGDTLFSGGCGRIFEGTAAQMLASLDKLAALPSNTRVCCAHEYTLSNLRFADAVEPSNTELQNHRARCEQLRARGQPTLPSLLETERAINPFLRSRQPAVMEAVRAQAPNARDEVAIFAALREWKNNF